MIVNIISPHASHYLGGMEIVTLQMAKYLSKQGVEVRFFTRKTENVSDVYQNLKNYAGEQLKLIEITLPSTTPLPDAGWSKFYQISCDFGVAAQTYYHKYSDADLFATHLSIDSIFVPRQSQTILHLHGSPVLTDPLMDAATHIPKATIAHSESIKSWWKDKFTHLNPTVFQNGIDIEYFSGDYNSTRKIDILYVGRLLEHKGIDDILNSISNQEKVVIAGNGNSFVPEINRIIKQRQLSNNVSLYVKPSTDTIQNLYRQAKIFACPSRGREGVLTTMLEAGASGCAIVTTSGAGMTDLAQDGRNALVVNPGDTGALSNAFNSLLQNNEQRLSLAKNMQQEIRNNWAWQSKITQLKDIYSESI